MSVPNLSCAGCLGARLERVTPNRQGGDRQTPDAGQTPGENNANSGPARLVPGPELSNESKDMQKNCIVGY